MSNVSKRLSRSFAALTLGALFMGLFGMIVSSQSASAEATAEATIEATAEAAATVETATEEAVVDDMAEEEAPLTLEGVAEGVATVQTNLDYTWILIAGFLVFFMQAGFAFLEAGMIGSNGSINSMAENFFDALLTGVFFWAVGWGLAYGTSNGFIGTDAFFFSGMDADGSNLDAGLYVNFFYQFAFAAAAATIVTGAIAERTDFRGKILYTIIIAAFIYPPVVHWVWSGSSGAFLYNAGYRDFAGSSVVHMVGGILALLGAIFIGPRLDRVWGSPTKGHNMLFATLGAFILWFGWYGFNVGSTLSASNPGLMGLVAVNTTIAGATGSGAAMFFVYFRTQKWDLPAILNGLLAGLVGITAGCAYVSPVGAFFIGLTAGVLVILTGEALERFKIDDAVGAFAVHGTCGALGCLAIGFWGLPALTEVEAGLFVGGGITTLLTQVYGVLVITAFTTAAGVVMWAIVKALGILRVTEDCEKQGLDQCEHGQDAYVIPS